MVHLKLIMFQSFQSNFFAASIMYVVWRFSNTETKAGKLAEAKIGAFVCGLALTNQHTSVLFIAPTALWVSHLVILLEILHDN